MSKNPFELRTDMLAMAKDYLDQQYTMNVEFATRMVKEGKKSIEDMQSYYKMYSMEELTEKAKEMYAFVSKKD